MLNNRKQLYISIDDIKINYHVLYVSTVKSLQDKTGDMLSRTWRSKTDPVG